jgi:hypothetical protein
MPIIVPTPTPSSPPPGTVSMTPLSSFYPLITYTVLGAPEPLIDQLLVRMAIQFCRKTNCVQLIQPAVDIVADQAEYTVTPPTEMTVNKVLRAWYKRTPLTPTVPDMIDEALAYRTPIDDEDAESGTPKLFYQQTPDVSAIKLWPIPNEAVIGGLSLRVSFKPVITATQLPSILLTEWGQEFCAGVRGALHAMPGQVFTDSGRAEMEMAEFARGMNTSAIQVNTGNIRGHMRVRGNPLF